MDVKVIGRPRAGSAGGLCKILVMVSLRHPCQGQGVADELAARDRRKGWNSLARWSGGEKDKDSSFHLELKNMFSSSRSLSFLELYE